LRERKSKNLKENKSVIERVRVITRERGQEGEFERDQKTEERSRVRSLEKRVTK